MIGTNICDEQSERIIDLLTGVEGIDGCKVRGVGVTPRILLNSQGAVGSSLAVEVIKEGTIRKAEGAR